MNIKKMNKIKKDHEKWLTSLTYFERQQHYINNLINLLNDFKTENDLQSAKLEDMKNISHKIMNEFHVHKCES